ncbi:hypothetical protein [Lentzea sp. HUAS12]|uniref:hypothetical protein n=1 Tax=Lentzea sp. HUAS12 TaxID=2951806 RepID=UPI0020A1675D|nr:hypothetical protein [Lentzea sp. HUAS12]USX49165.1 hypothetical protein ND450_27425 [Lentzea sp. HUAS12]
MSENLYGSRPDLLPAFMATAKKRDVLGVEVLTAEENHALEERSLNRFAHLSSGRIRWEGVPVVTTSFRDEDHGVQVLGERLLEVLGEETDLVIFWGTLVMPTVSMSSAVALGHLNEIVQEAPDFWIFLPSRMALVEFMQDGIVTTAEVS